MIDAWDIQWFYTCLRSNALSIVPRVNLIANIGVIGTHPSRTWWPPRHGCVGHMDICSARSGSTRMQIMTMRFLPSRLRPKVRTQMNGM